jgi:hypothetical protein
MLVLGNGHVCDVDLEDRREAGGHRPLQGSA